jgi:hypothetical protein
MPAPDVHIPNNLGRISPEIPPAPSAAAQEACLNPANQPEAQPPRSVRRPKEILEEAIDVIVASGQLATEEAMTDAPEDSQPPAIFVERRRISDTPLTVALCEPTPEMTRGVATAVKDCDVVVFTPIGCTNDARRKHQEGMCTKLVSSDADPKWRDSILATVRDEGDYDEGDYVGGVLNYMRDTDKTIRTIGINMVDSKFSGVEERCMAEHKEARVLEQLGRVDTMREAVHERIRATDEVNRATNEEVSAQLRALVAEIEQKRPGASIGVVSHPSQWESIDRISEPDANTEGAHFEAKTTRGMTLFDSAVQAYSDGEQERVTALVEKHLLAEYLGARVDPSRAGQVQELVKGLTGAEVAEKMGALERDLAGLEEPFDAVTSKVETTLQPYIDSVLEDASPSWQLRDEQNLRPEQVGAIVGHRRAEGTDIVTVLCAHVPKYSAEIAESLKDCDVLMFEQVGIENETKRRLYEDKVTALLRPENANELALFAATWSENFVAQTLAKLPPTGKERKVVCVDVLQDDPGYQWYLGAERVKARYIKGVRGLVPLGKSRTDLMSHMIANMAASSIREAITVVRIKEVIKATQQWNPEASIGVVVGGLHRNAVAPLGVEVGESISERIKENFEDHSIYTKMIAAAREDDTEQVIALSDRMLLVYYLSRFLHKANDRDNETRILFYVAVDQMVERLTDESVAEIMAALEKDLADPKESVASKTAKVEATLRPGIRLVRAISA